MHVMQGLFKVMQRSFDKASGGFSLVPPWSRASLVEVAQCRCSLVW
jgi:hypothetical protein